MPAHPMLKPTPDLRIAAAYIRVSTDDQVELSPASQLVEIRKWAASHGYIVPDEYVYRDEGITGRKVVGRDAFRQMIGMAKTKPKPFDAILLWKFSRFARNRDDAVMYKSILRKQLGIDVLSISEPMADGKMGIITEALIEAMDEYYSLNLAEEVRRGMEEAAKRGKLQATPAYGYTVKEHILAPIEPEATHVKEISAASTRVKAPIPSPAGSTAWARARTVAASLKTAPSNTSCVTPFTSASSGGIQPVGRAETSTTKISSLRTEDMNR